MRRPRPRRGRGGLAENWVQGLLRGGGAHRRPQRPPAQRRHGGGTPGPNGSFWGWGAHVGRRPRTRSGSFPRGGSGGHGPPGAPRPAPTRAPAACGNAAQSRGDTRGAEPCRGWGRRRGGPQLWWAGRRLPGHPGSPGRCGGTGGWREAGAQRGAAGGPGERGRGAPTQSTAWASLGVHPADMNPTRGRRVGEPRASPPGMPRGVRGKSHEAGAREPHVCSATVGRVGGGLAGVGATMAHGGAGEVAPGMVLGGSWCRGSAGRSLGDPSPIQTPGFLLVGGGTTRSWGARNCPPAAPAR